MKTLPPLLARVVTEADIDWAGRIVWVESPLPDGALRGLETVLSEVENAMLPATNEERMACLGELLTVFPMPVLDGQAARETRWGVYHKALCDLPADVLADACREIMQTATFFPKPVDIRNAAQKRLGRRINVLTKLRAIKKFKIVSRAEERAEPTPEQRARVLALAARATRGMDR